MMKFINFVSDLDMEDYSKVSFTANVDDIKVIQPEFNIINLKTGNHSQGYSIHLKSREMPIALQINDYETVQEFLSNDDKYLKINVEWL